MAYEFAPDQELITNLQITPKPPVVIPAVPYPEQTGEYKGSRWYSTALNLGILSGLIDNYLSFLSQCKEIISFGEENEEVKNLSQTITADKYTFYDKAEAVHSWVFENVQYKMNPTIVSPWELIKKGASGDCKSFACLVASLLGVNAIPSWLKLIKIDGIDILHIYSMSNLSWEAVDGTGKYPFREVSPISGYLIFEVDRTSQWPPKPLPQLGLLDNIPEETKETLKKIAIIGGIVGVLGLGAYFGIKK